MKLWFLYQIGLKGNANKMKKITDMPLLYDLLYQGVVEDIVMYLKIAQPYKEILEYGAGTGRVTIPLLEAGHSVWAVDLEMKMLNRLNQKVKNKKIRQNLKLIRANICEYRAPQKFSCIIVPLTTFNYLLTLEQQNNCLKGIYDNLANDGIAVIELLSLKTFGKNDEKLQFVKNIKIDDETNYQYFRKTKLDLAKRSIKQKRVFKLFKKNVQIDTQELIWINRFVTIDDFSKLCAQNNLEIVNIFGDCQMNTYDAKSEDVFLIIKKKKIKKNK